MKPLLFALAVSILPLAARAGVDEIFTGGRSMAMGGAHRGIGSSNDTLYLNPAGMALLKRYAVELQYGYANLDDLSRFNFSAVDSKSGPVAGGFGYTHVRGGTLDAGLHHFYLGSAVPISDALALGFTLHHIRGDVRDVTGVRDDLSVYTGDVGIMAMLAEGVTVGVAYNNVLETDRPELTPPMLGFGLGATFGALTLGADVAVGVGDASDRGASYHAGGEYFIGDAYPVRVGYSRARFVELDGTEEPENLVSAGAGWLTLGGALEIAYRRSIERSENWDLVAALKLFL